MSGLIQLEKAERLHSNPFQRRVAFDVEGDADWKCFLEGAPHPKATPLETLGYFTFSEDAAGALPDIISAAFRLCCRYKQLRQAALLLEKLSNPGPHLLQFAETLATGMRSAPLILYTPSYSAWQRVLRGAWARVPTSFRMTDQDLILIHEVLHSQGITLASSMPGLQGDVLRRKLMGELEDEDVAGLLDEDVRHLHNFSSSTPDNLLNQLRQAVGNRSGVALASLALVGGTSDEYDLFLVIPGGRFIPDRERLLGHQLRNEAKKFAGLHAPHRRLVFPQVPGLLSIAQKIQGLLADVKTTHTLLLCVDAEFAGIPWQALLRRLGCLSTVALVPSIGWVSERMLRPKIGPIQNTISNVLFPSDKIEFVTSPTGIRVPGLLNLLDLVHGDANKLQRQFPETFFILSHGWWDENLARSLFTAAASSSRIDSDLNQILELALKRGVVIHACYGGLNAGRGLGDLSGLAGLCLAARGRFFLGPLGQVSPLTAGILHKHLIAAKKGTTIGEIYSAAIQEDERVAQYALFGLPWETGG